MAHHSKFISVNLNKSYGQSSASSSSSAFIHGRSRPGFHASTGGGGMVVLSRSRSTTSSGTKAASRLAVPPPLNLPSLRKEHERLDPASSSSVPGQGSSGLGLGSGSSTTGWSKPAAPSSSAVEKDASANGGLTQFGRPILNVDQIVSSAYTPPGARPGGQLLVPSPVQGFAEKAVILRGEDFPSLRATASSASKQKESSSQKQKVKPTGEQVSGGRSELPDLRVSLEMRPQMRNSRLVTSNATGDNGESNPPLGASQQSRKHDDYLPDPLPLVRLRHTTDWADDERDTGLSIPERHRDRGSTRFESVQFNDAYDGRGPHDSEVGSSLPREILRGDSFVRDVNRDFSSWRSTLQPRERLPSRESRVDREKNEARPLSAGRDLSQSLFKGSALDDSGVGSQDSRYSRWDSGFHVDTHNGKAATEGFSVKTTEQNSRGRFDDMDNWYKGGPFQKAAVSKGHFSSINKGSSMCDPIMNFSKEKRPTSSERKQYIDDANFESKDKLVGGGIGDVNIKVFKRKKDVTSKADFHDPIRASYEEELERILRMQEQERQRIIEEQERALELSRKEEEERERLVREEGEKRRLLEEEAREAAWREEQERLEVARRAEEQRIAREEEKKRYQIEEERRKEAARQKLLELEARIARRHAEDKTKNDGFSSVVAPDDTNLPLSGSLLGDVDVRDWEDGDRIVEHISSSCLSDTTSMTRHSNVAYRMQSEREGNSSFIDRGKHSFYDSSIPFKNHDNIHHTAEQDMFDSRRGISKDFHDVPGPILAKPSSRGGSTEPSNISDDYPRSRHHRWNSNREGDQFSRNSSDVDAEFVDNDKFGEVGWIHSNSHVSPNALYSDRSFQSSEGDSFSSFTKYRPFVRQPHVFPPPSSTPMPISPFRPLAERATSSFIDEETCKNSVKNDMQNSQIVYDNVYHDNLWQNRTKVPLEENSLQSERHQEKVNRRCDSQSSLSVSSPPSSPTPLSHDEMDVAGDSPALPTSADGERTILSDNEDKRLGPEVGGLKTMSESSSVSAKEDEWIFRHNVDTQVHEEYDEEDGDYQDIDTHEIDDNVEVGQELADSHHDVLTVAGEMEHVILGFNEGIEVKIPINSEYELKSTNAKEEIKQPMGSASVEGLSTLPDIRANSSLTVASESEKAIQDLPLDSVAMINPATTIAVSFSSGKTMQLTMSPPKSLPLATTSSNSPILPSSSTIVNQGEAPIKLQFGLFSGPPLIPSPVPAIQIGSIRMPIHVHPHINSSLSQVHPSQPPLFQFGQLRYPPTISQNILPLPPHNMAFVQSPVPPPFSFNQNPAGFSYNQASRDSSCQNNTDVGENFSSSDKQTDPAQNLYNSSRERLNCEQPITPSNPSGNVTQTSQSSIERSTLTEKKNVAYANAEATTKKSYRPVAGKRNYHVQQHVESHVSLPFSGGNAPPKPPGSSYGVRGKRYAYVVRNTGTRSTQPGDTLSTGPMGFQRRSRRNIRRTEFRVRENIERKETSGEELLMNADQHEKPTPNERSLIITKNLGKRDAVSQRLAKITSDLDNLKISNPGVQTTDDKNDKDTNKESATKTVNSSNKWSIRKNILNHEDDVDTSLQSGVVRVYNQPGIEAPSDDDDFIEVRSKRQMLNDRREQRGKEMKSKPRVTKAPRKQHIARQTNLASSISNKGGDISTISHSRHQLVRGGRGSSKLDPSLGYASNMTSHTLSPNFAPSVSVHSKTEPDGLKSSMVVSFPTASVDTNLIPAPLFENEKLTVDNSGVPLNSWDSGNVTHQVMALTQTQLDEAMKPAEFSSHLPSHSLEPKKPALSAKCQEKNFSSSTSAISSLLAGEKIQFGAVTSPTILPPANRAVTSGLGAPGSFRTEVKAGQDLPADCTTYFGKDKRHGESCPNIDDVDAEAEAEAAASAVAVAAISNDEIVGSSIGGSSGSTVSCSKGVADKGEITGQSTSEESLIVSLPADLSVDGPSLSWPPLPSPQASGPMLSHFPGAPPSHFPCFEMNPMMGARIFSYGPHDESANSQGQSQRSATLGSGPLGAWTQCHSGVDPFYAPPAGFTGPFIGPGGLAGVQAPSHMVVYNHFAPVGQFGQVGLSFMGTTYIPSGKQPQWKQNQVASVVGEGEGDIGNANVVNGQSTAPSMPATIQHLGPPSSLMPIATPLTMFDIAPFQSSPDLSMQARWSHVPAPPLHSVPLSVPLQQHLMEGGLPSEFSHTLPADSSAANNRLLDHRSSIPSEGNRNILIPCSSSSKFSNELGLMEHPTSSSAISQTTRSYSSGSASYNKVEKTSTGATIVSLSDSGSISTSSRNGCGRTIGSSSKPSQTTSGQQYLNSGGHSDLRGGPLQKGNSGGEWHRRAGFNVRNQASGADKNVGTSKMKQIYVAKPSSSGRSSQS